MSQIIIPRYRNESPRFQRASDYVFGSQEGYERYIARLKREVWREARAIARDETGEKRRNLEGVGQVVANVSMHDYMLWKLLHPGCWKDKGFIREYRRDNEYCRASRPEQKTFSVGAITAT